MFKKNAHDLIISLNKSISNEEFVGSISSAVNLITSSLKSGGRLYVAGNGGSAADAQHFVAEFVSKLARDRGPLAAESLTTDTSIITAISNDYGYENIFSRQLECKAGIDDVFFAITTSGNSANIVKALSYCKENAIRTILLAGRGGGLCKALADICILVEADRTSTIQEVHIIVEHTICESVEHNFFK